jgi:hypothetical protein
VFASVKNAAFTSWRPPPGLPGVLRIEPYASSPGLNPWAQSIRRLRLAAIARVLFRVFPSTSPYRELLKQFALFCAAGLFVALLVMTYGLDLSAGFF